MKIILLIIGFLIFARLTFLGHLFAWLHEKEMQRIIKRGNNEMD